MAEQPHPTMECDIVMKGGITSGVVYPSAVRQLATRYRFRNIGGASVGAIAAAVTAAAEYGRQRGTGTGFDELRTIDTEMVEEGFLLSLFKPRPSARRIYAIYLDAIRKRWSRVLWTLGSHPAAVAGSLLWLITLVATAVMLGARWWFVPLAIAVWGAAVAIVLVIVLGRTRVRTVLISFLVPLAWPFLFSVTVLGASAWRDLSAGGFGFVGGSSETGDSLCDWLHGHIQRAAGLPPDRPLTFGMLKTDTGTDGKPVGIDLQMMTTNLSLARPMRVPAELEGYSFRRSDLEGVLPPGVIDALTGESAAADGDALIQLPKPDDLPVLLGFRLSLSFPLLFTALPLHAPAAPLARLGPAPVKQWFSDGGIASNFPIHFFDAWVPRRPTFALSFGPLALDDRGQPAEPDVGIPPAPNEPRLPRWVEISNMGAFVGQILDTMQNWRDNLQAELPGFSDRVYEARLNKAMGEGGLNLAMGRETIQRLQERGDRVGAKILETFQWDQHFFTRFLVAMQQLELGLVGAPAIPGSAGPRTGLRDAFAPRAWRFESGDMGAAETFGFDPSMLRTAGAATKELLETVEHWSAWRGFVRDAPRPQPVMRITPRA